MNSQVANCLILPAEFEVREFWGRTLLACFAAERGIPSVVGDQRTIIKTHMHYLPKGLVLLKSIDPRLKARLTSYAEKGFALASLDEEGIGATHRDSFGRHRFSAKTISLTQRVLFWGETDFEQVAALYPEFIDRFRKTGNARTDLWRPPLSKICDGEADRIRSRYGEFLLIPSNFGSLLTGRSIEECVTNRMAYLSEWSQEEADFSAVLATVANEVILKYVEAIKRLSKRIHIVVRPHPAESIDIWKSLLKDVDNVSIVYDGPVAPWLEAAKVVVHHRCTTAIEAYLRGKPCIIYSPETDTPSPDKCRHPSSHLANLSHTVSTLDELDALLSNIHDLQPKPAGDSLERVLSVREGVFSAEAILDNLQDLLDCSLESAIPVVRRLNGLSAHAFQIRAKTAVAGLLRLGAHGSKGYGKSSEGGRSAKWRRVKTSEVKNFVNHAGSLLNRFENLTVKSAGKNVFLVLPGR